METSLPGEFTKTDASNWAKNLLIFAAPLGTIYVAFVLGNFAGGGFEWAFFAPNATVDGALALYVLNAIADFLRKTGQTTITK